MPQIILKPALSAAGASGNSKQIMLSPPAPPSVLPRVEITDERPGDTLRISKAAVANYHASLLRILWKASTIEEATEIAKEALEFARR